MMTEAQEAEHREAETKERVELFMKALDIDDMMARILIQEGFAKVEDIAYISLDELTGIEGFDEDLAEELQNRAKAYLVARQDTLSKQIEEQQVSDDIKKMEGLTLDMVAALGNAGIKTLDDFADLASDELIEIVGERNMDTETANALIMKAREHWFEEGKL